jgi:hypothetical protein
MSAAPRLPPLGFQIVYVNMAALADIGDDAADIMSILQHRVANFQVTESNLVTERYGIQRLETNGFVGFHDPTSDFLAWLDIFDNHDANGVGFVVHDEISGHEVVFPPIADLRVVNLI